jgi:HSP20 family protein
MTEQSKLEKVTTQAIPPRVDVFENETELLLVADLPGVAKDAVEVKFDDGELSIAATRSKATEAEGTLLRRETEARDYHRLFSLPDGIDVEKVSAELDTGVLRVHLPKAAQKRARRIEVRGA